MRKSLLVMSFVACCALLISSVPAVAADNWIGSWKLDTAKSKFKPGPAPKSLTLKFEAVEGGIKLTSHTVDAAGKSAEAVYVSKFDGSDVPWKGNPEADTASAKRVNDNSYQNVWKKDGKVTINSKVLVSADGKTLTVVQTGKNAKGAAVENIEIFNRE